MAVRGAAGSRALPRRPRWERRPWIDAAMEAAAAPLANACHTIVPRPQDAGGPVPGCQRGRQQRPARLVPRAVEQGHAGAHACVRSGSIVVSCTAALSMYRRCRAQGGRALCAVQPGRAGRGKQAAAGLWQPLDCHAPPRTAPGAAAAGGGANSGAARLLRFVLAPRRTSRARWLSWRVAAASTWEASPTRPRSAAGPATPPTTLATVRLCCCLVGWSVGRKPLRVRLRAAARAAPARARPRPTQRPPAALLR